MLAAMTAKIDRLENEQRSKKDVDETNLGSEDVLRRRHDIQAISHVITDKGRAQQKMGTRGSVCTANVLEALPDIKRTREQLLGERFLRVFQNPTEFIGYLSSEEFGNDLAVVCQAVGEIFENEPRCVFLQSPVYVFGDIHGNLEDLHFFADNIWKLGMDLTAGKFLFLGDYVDRGLSSLECVAYLFGLKLLYPSKIHLLRGNHETRDVSQSRYLFSYPFCHLYAFNKCDSKQLKTVIFVLISDKFRLILAVSKFFLFSRFAPIIMRNFQMLIFVICLLCLCLFILFPIYFLVSFILSLILYFFLSSFPTLSFSFVLLPTFHYTGEWLGRTLP